MKNRVMHILGTAQPEGAVIARMVAELARGMVPNQYRIAAWFLGGEGPWVGRLRDAGVEVHAISWSNGARDPAGAWRFWHSLTGREFEIVHLHFGGRFVSWIARARTRAKTVLHLHGRVIESQGIDPALFSGRGFDAVITNSRAVAETVADARPQVVYPGISIPPAWGTSGQHNRNQAERVIGTAARLVPLKGIIHLLQAMALLQDDLPDLKLEIAGSGPERPSLEREAQRLGLAEQVTFLGWVEDVSAVLDRWRVFALPSLEEAFGMAALEAMAAGLPVVATAVGGIPELVENGKTGWLVPPGDPKALADRLRQLLHDPEGGIAMGKSGQVRARESFSVEQMVAAIARVYDSLLGPHRESWNPGTDSHRSRQTK